MKIDPDYELISEIRKRSAMGVTPAAILHWLATGGLCQPEMMIQLQAAFGLDLSEVSCIDGWTPDGKGELKDADINRLLEPAIISIAA